VVLQALQASVAACPGTESFRPVRFGRRGGKDGSSCLYRPTPGSAAAAGDVAAVGRRRERLCDKLWRHDHNTAILATAQGPAHPMGPRHWRSHRPPTNSQRRAAATASTEPPSTD